MENKKTAHIIKGMQKDLSPSKKSSEFAIDAKNIRLTSRGENTLLSITNEKGTKDVSDYTVTGDIIGHVRFKDAIVIFSKDESKDFITLFNTKGKKKTLWNKERNLNNSLNLGDYIEALVSIESENLVKIYWIDGVNQPRIMFLNRTEDEFYSLKNNKFDFNVELQLKETLNITKLKGSGNFVAGVIQYAFNYYNKGLQESNIVDVSPIQYISYFNRGAEAGKLISNSFKIEINNVDTNFEYIRIYSIHRTS